MNTKLLTTYYFSVLSLQVVQTPTKVWRGIGGFQLVDLIITELKNHMTCFDSMPLIGWNYSIQTGEPILQRIFLKK